MNEKIAKVLAEYEKSCNQEWQVRGAQEALRQEMSRLCGVERKIFRRKVRAVMARARPGWSLADGGDVRVDVNHIRPMKVQITVRVRLFFCQGARRGEVTLHGNYAEMDALLEEMKKVTQ